MSTWYDANQILIQQTLTTVLLALSVQLPLRAGVFSFAGVGAYGIGGYAAAIAVVHLGWGTAPALLLGTAAPAVVTYALGLVVQRLRGLYLGMATISFTLIVSVLAVNGGSLTGGASGLFGALGSITTGGLALIVVIVLAAVSLTEVRGLGRRIDTVRVDPELATAMGINVGAYRRATFLVSGAAGGLAGAITTLIQSTITPDQVNFHLVVLALTVIVVGGSRSWIGVLIGSIVFVWLPTWLSFVSKWEDIVYGVLVALAAIYLPDGLLGVIVRTWRRIDPRQPSASEMGDAEPHEQERPGLDAATTVSQEVS